jgi:hypothetical protein
MVNDRNSSQRVHILGLVVKRARREADKVSIQLLTALLTPMSNVRVGLKAHHIALVKLADGAQLKIERLREGRG